MTTVISVENLSKAYRIGQQAESSDSLVGAMFSLAASPIRNFRRLSSLDTFRNQREEESLYWALRDVSFEVKEGDVVGIIGRNGAGKSTLLKILSRITQPTTGRAVLRGRVSSLLEVGTGFHQELSGRENVYLNGTILGMKKREIDRKFDEIVEFSGIEKFLDTPVKRYSSGMKVRLAFAVAAHLEPEILIIDEVLAVGDFEFQRKCLGKMESVAKSGRTVLFVSHDMGAVQKLCNSGIILVGGKVAFNGSTEEVVSAYLQDSLSTKSEYDVDLTDHSNRILATSPVLQRLRLTNNDGKTSLGVELGAPLTFELHVGGSEEHRGVAIGIHIYDKKGQRVMTCNSSYQSVLDFSLCPNRVIRCRIPSIRLMPGKYSVVIGVAAGRKQLDRIDPALSFEVLPRDIFGTGSLPPTRDGIFVPDTAWEIGELNINKNDLNPTGKQ